MLLYLPILSIYIWTNLYNIYTRILIYRYIGSERSTHHAPVK